MYNSSKEILEGLARADRQLMDDLYKKIFPQVRRFVLSNSGTKEDAKEVFQEGLYQIIVRAKTTDFRIESNFQGYIYTVCKNIWYRSLKRSAKEVRNDKVHELVDKKMITIEDIMFQERWDLFQSKMVSLSDNCRQLLQAYFKKTPYETIVREYGYASQNVAFQRIFKCKKKLAQLIKDDPQYKDLL